MKFTSELAGTVTGIRFYKAAANTGTHIGSLWTSTGTLLASATFTNETASGWQQVNFSTPVAITAGTTYVAGYFAPKGHYSATSSPFASTGRAIRHFTRLPTPRAQWPLRVQFGEQLSHQHLQRHQLLGRRHVPEPPPGQVTNVTAPSGPGSATVSWTAPASGGPATIYT